MASLTIGTIPVATSSTNCQDSSVTDDGSTVTVNEDLTVTGLITGDGDGLTNVVHEDVVTTFTAQQVAGQMSLIDASPIAWDLNNGQAAYVLLTAAVGGTRQLQNPTNQVAGGTYTLIVKQSSIGSNALTFGSAYKFPGGTAPTLSTANNAVDVLTFLSDGTLMLGASSLNFS